jgi:hypothetical protein
MKKIIHFMGLLANVDKSILNVEFRHGFKPEYMIETEGVAILEKLLDLPYMELATKRSSLSLYNYKEQRFYFMSNTIEVSADIEVENRSDVLDKVTYFENNLIYRYLRPTLRLMRLFKAGNICMPISIYCYTKCNIFKPFMRRESQGPVLPELFSLQPVEVEALEKFINETKLPFKEPYLNLALDNFELSYQAPNLDIRFLLLMMTLEALFNRGQPELKYTISRNSAVLLGRDNNEASRTFEDMNRLYGIRSKIVHANKSKLVRKEDLSELYSYIRKAIIKIHALNVGKDELFLLLNSKGFGEMG